MNEKQLPLVSFVQAKRLKAEGFDWGTSKCYETKKPDKLKNYAAMLYANYDLRGTIIPAPTVALALKWFRDMKGFDYSIIKGRLPFEYSFSLLNGTVGKLCLPTYEAAESALLNELLKLNENEND